MTRLSSRWTLAGSSLEEVVEQAHQAGDLLGGAFPVFDREGVEGDVADADGAGGIDDRADCLDAAAVSLQPGKAARLGPAAVAVHDDGNVLRDLAGCGRRHAKGAI